MRKNQLPTTSGSNQRQRRVFILGAGASLYAGFPLATKLWSFLLDHNDVDMGGMEWIDAHLAAASPAERERLTSDIELLLSTYQAGQLPRVAGLRDRSVPPPEGSEEDKALLRASQRHLMEKAKPFDFDSYYRARIIRRGSGAVNWGPQALSGLVESIRTAFLHHHVCIRFGKNCYSPKEPWTVYAKCPCFPQRSFHQKHWRTREAIKRIFAPGDTIVTFNWDALLESILWSAGRWSFSDGYGFETFMAPSFRRSLSRKTRSMLSRESPIKVLKAHGSINWVTTPTIDSVALEFVDAIFGLPISNTYTYSMNEEFPDWPYTQRVFLAPTYMKDYSTDPILGENWDRIISALKDADQVTVIGYSLPPEDAISRNLLAHALRQNTRCKELHIVAPEGVQDTQWAGFSEGLRKGLRRVGRTLESWVAGDEWYGAKKQK